MSSGHCYEKSTKRRRKYNILDENSRTVTTQRNRRPSNKHDDYEGEDAWDVNGDSDPELAAPPQRRARRKKTTAPPNWASYHAAVKLVKLSKSPRNGDTVNTEKNITNASMVSLEKGEEKPAKRTRKHNILDEYSCTVTTRRNRRPPMKHSDYDDSEPDPAVIEAALALADDAPTEPIGFLLAVAEMSTPRESHEPARGENGKLIGFEKRKREEQKQHVKLEKERVREEKRRELSRERAEQDQLFKLEKQRAREEVKREREEQKQLAKLEKKRAREEKKRELP